MNLLPKINVQIRLSHHKRAEWRATLHPSYAAGGICSRNCSAACMQQSENTARLQPVWRNCCWIRLHIRAAPQEQRGRLTLSVCLTQIHSHTHSNLKCPAVPEILRPSLKRYLKNEIMRDALEGSFRSVLILCGHNEKDACQGKLA